VPGPGDAKVAGLGLEGERGLQRVCLSCLKVWTLLGKHRMAQMDFKQGNKTKERQFHDSSVRCSRAGSGFGSLNS
jgi:hypothetical protein